MEQKHSVEEIIEIIESENFEDPAAWDEACRL